MVEAQNGVARALQSLAQPRALSKLKSGMADRRHAIRDVRAREAWRPKRVIYGRRCAGVMLRLRDTPGRSVTRRGLRVVTGHIYVTVATLIMPISGNARCHDAGPG